MSPSKRTVTQWVGPHAQHQHLAKITFVPLTDSNGTIEVGTCTFGEAEEEWPHPLVTDLPKIFVTGKSGTVAQNLLTVLSNSQYQSGTSTKNCYVCPLGDNKLQWNLKPISENYLATRALYSMPPTTTTRIVCRFDGHEAGHDVQRESGALALNDHLPAFAERISWEAADGKERCLLALCHGEEVLLEATSQAEAGGAGCGSCCALGPLANAHLIWRDEFGTLRTAKSHEVSAGLSEFAQPILSACISAGTHTGDWPCQLDGCATSRDSMLFTQDEPATVWVPTMET